MDKFQKIKSLAVKSAKQMWRDKIRTFSLMLFPIVMIGLFGSAVGSDTTGLKTGVVYNEESRIAPKLVQGFHAADTFDIEKRVGSFEHGERLIREGELDVLIILPQKLNQTISSGEQATIRVMADEANPDISQTAIFTAREIIHQVSTNLSINQIQKKDRSVFKLSESLMRVEEGSDKIKEAMEVQEDKLQQTGTSIDQISHSLLESSKNLRGIGINVGRTSYSLETISESLENISEGLENLSDLEMGENFSTPSTDEGISRLYMLLERTELMVSFSDNIPRKEKAKILRNLYALEDGISQIESILDAYSSAISGFENSMENISDNMGFVAGSIENVGSRVLFISQNLKRTQGGVERINGILERNAESLNQVQRSIDRISGVSGESAEGLDSLGDQIGEISNGLRGVVDKDPSFLSNPLKFSRETPYGEDLEYIDFLAPGIIALTIFMGSVMGLGRAIAGERQDGSLTRVFLTPTSNATIILGTSLFYSGFEFLRGLVILFASIILFDLTVVGSFPLVLLTIGITAAGSVGLGLFLSSRLKNEDQFTAVSMVVVIPMMFISGVFFPVQNMANWLQALSRVIPLRYAANALRGIMVRDLGLSMISQDILFLVVFAFTTLTLGGIFFKREVMT